MLNAVSAVEDEMLKRKKQKIRGKNRGFLSKHIKLIMALKTLEIKT
jgi:hypothetical protein